MMMCGLPLFKYYDKIKWRCLLNVNAGNGGSHQTAAEPMASIFQSPRHREIFQDMSRRYSETETAEATERNRKAAELKRVYFASFRRDALMLVHDDSIAAALLAEPLLSKEQYRPGLEAAYPMFYLSVCLHMFGPERVRKCYCLLELIILYNGYIDVIPGCFSL
jgi:hypothetical protein